MNSMEGGGLERVHLHIECSPWWWGGGPVASRWFPQSKVHEATRSVAAFNQFIQWPFELVDDLLTMCWVVPLTTLSKLVGFHQIWSFFWTTFFLTTFWPSYWTFNFGNLHQFFGFFFKFKLGSLPIFPP